MKKTLYIAAALLAFVGCSKKELAPETAVGGHDISLSVVVENDPETRVFFDGDSHIKFNKFDKFYAGIANPSSPTTAVEVSSKKNGSYKRCYSEFQIVDSSAVQPVFQGSFYNIADADFVKEYNLYGIFPFSAASTYRCGEDLTQWAVSLPEKQASTQDGWEGKYAAMVLKPTLVSFDDDKIVHDEKYKDNVIEGNTLSVTFAHLFGFAKLKFADIPEKYKDEVVKTIVLEAVGEDKVVAGTFKIDVTKDVDEIVLDPYSKMKKITLTGDGKTTVSDYTAWFIMKPGTFDVKITVSTAAADFLFERQGLEIKRNKIAAPTVHLKETDTTVSHDVVLADGETWTVGEFDAYGNCLTSYSPIKAWGTGEKKMNFFVEYPGSVNGNYPSSQSTDYDYFVQQLSNKPLLGGLIVLSSEAEFSGMKMIKTNFGIYTADATADFSVVTEKDGKETVVGTVTVTGDGTNVKGQDYFFSVPDAGQAGKLKIKVNNLSNDEARPYLGALVINPAPEIVFDAKEIKVAKAAATGEFTCGVFAAEGEPTVTFSDDAKDWLSNVTYKEGKITYTVAENTGKKRSAVITVSAKGLSEVSASIKLTQASATEVEYKLSVTAKDVNAAIAAAKTSGKTFSDVDTFTGNFKATATDGTDKSVDVEVKFGNLRFNSVTDDVFMINGQLSQIAVTSALGFVEQVVIVASKKLNDTATSYSDLAVKLSSDGENWSYYGGKYESGDYYTSTLTNEDESLTWFQINCNAWSAISFKSFAVTFVVD